ncbi:MAG: hypothetical protein AMS19_02520 [Gemmatimonas sp. SG8_23]|nr:MAG: hypothetical protein AMS19_02520 [Gemmatimonas sp. SG8_23]
MRGDTDPFQITLRDGDGQPLDITGSTFLLTASELQEPSSEDPPVFQLEGEVVAPGTNGIVRFTPTAEQADNAGVFFYDVEKTSSSGSIRTVLKGTYTLLEDITKTVGEATIRFTGTDGADVPMDGSELFYAHSLSVSGKLVYAIRDSRTVVRFDGVDGSGVFPMLGPRMPRRIFGNRLDVVEVRELVYIDAGLQAGLAVNSPGYHANVRMIADHPNTFTRLAATTFSPAYSGITSDAAEVTPGWWYRKLRVEPAYLGTPVARMKYWEEGNSEPDWSLDTTGGGWTSQTILGPWELIAYLGQDDPGYFDLFEVFVRWGDI